MEYKYIMAVKYAVIDTETSWQIKVLSIGVVIAQDGVFEVIDKKYMILKRRLKSGNVFLCSGA